MIYIIDKIIDIITLIDIINKREREVFTLKQTLFDIIDRREGGHLLQREPCLTL